MVRIRLLKPMNCRPAGTTFDAFPGDAEQWIREGKAERCDSESLVPDNPRGEHMIPRGRRAKRLG
jgi:hypothetical protein